MLIGLLKNKWAITILFFCSLVVLSLVIQAYNREFAPVVKYDKLAIQSYRQGNYEQAIENWKKVLEINPRDRKTLNKIGMAYLESEQIDKAVQFYADCSKAHPKDLDLRYNLALSYFRQGKLEQGWQELEKIQQLNRLFPQLHYLRGLIYEKKGDFAQAKKEFIKEININPDCLGAWYKLKKYREGGR